MLIAAGLPLGGVQAGESARPAAAPLALPGPTLTVNFGAPQHAISDDIYGMNFTQDALADELDLTVVRWGGNATTRYNYLVDADNRGSDWFFENINSNHPNPAMLPEGSAADLFVQQNNSFGADTILTVPLIGWVTKDRNGGCGFAVSLYGAQQSTDYWRPNCGNGVTLGGVKITGNNPLDTSIPADHTFVQGWVAHLVDEHGTAANGGVQFYALDNEPMIWHETHRDVHPNGATYDEVLNKGIATALAIKTEDPSAQVLGPVLFGWTAYWNSGAEMAQGGAWWNNLFDRAAHGGMPFLPWYLQQMAQAEVDEGQRLLDYLDIHYYPQSPGVTLAPAGNASTQALRLRSTRSLWDPTYVDESWIGTSGTEGGPYVRLIPRMREWINTYYPGTKLAITEYNWGGVEHINGALAQADVLGIFGRERVDLATMWDPPSSSQPAAYAFRMYRNYDGAGSKFGSLSVAASSSDASVVSIFAAHRPGDNVLTVMLINKTGSEYTSTLNVSSFVDDTLAGRYQYSGANLNAIVRASSLLVVNGYVGVTLPPNSITLVEISGSMPVNIEQVYLPLVRR